MESGGEQMPDPRISIVQKVLTITDFKRLRSQPFHYPDVAVLKNIRRKKSENKTKELPFDLYLPKSIKGPLPLIIDIHGGGLVYGNKELNRWSAAETARRGYAVVLLDYPLIPTATLPEQVQAILNGMGALDLLHRIPFDKDRVFLRGDSAGGLLSVLTLAVLNDPSIHQQFKITHDYKIQGTALIHPMVETKRNDILGFIPDFIPDFHPLENHLTQEQNLSTISQEKTPRYFFEPLLGTSILPPTWLVTSENDFMFNLESKALAKDLKRNEIHHELNDFPMTMKVPLNHIFMITHPNLKQSQRMYDSMAEFFQKL
jgi:acetyl esterase/lipase